MTLASTLDRRAVAFVHHATQTWTLLRRTTAVPATTPPVALHAAVARAQAVHATAHHHQTTGIPAQAAIPGQNPAEDLAHHHQAPILATTTHAISTQTVQEAANLAAAPDHLQVPDHATTTLTLQTKAR